MQFGHPVGLRDNLPALEKALLWTMRAWVLGHCRRQPVEERIQTVFDYLKASEGAFHLEHFMQALSRGALRNLEVNCVCHEAVSMDEAALLEIFALQQREQHEEAFEKLASMTTEFAAMAGCDHANRAALALAEAGQILSCQAVQPYAMRRRFTATVIPISRALH
jgi:hypothetical protein